MVDFTDVLPLNQITSLPNENGNGSAITRAEHDLLSSLIEKHPQITEFAAGARKLYGPSVSPEQPVIDLERFKIHSAAEALKPQPPIDWVVKGLFAAGNVYAFCGDAGSKKTYMLLDCGLCIAIGEQWLDYQVQKSPVLLVDEESGEIRLNRRLNYIMRAHEADETTQLYFVTLARFDIRNPEDVNALQFLIEQTCARFVIIDALVDVIPGADENSSKDLQPGMLALGKLAKVTNCAIVLIHHTNKMGGYRGSSSIKGNVDGMFMIESKTGSSLVEVKTEKGRDVAPIQFTAFAHFENNALTGELETVWFSTADPVKKDPVYSKSESYVIQYLQEHGPSEIADITKNSTGFCTSSAAQRSVFSLAKKGLVYRTNAGGQGARGLYAIKTEEVVKKL